MPHLMTHLVLLALLLLAGWPYLHLPRLRVTLLAGSLLAPLTAVVERWLYADWPFAVSLAMLIGVDTALGVYRGYRTGTLSSHRFKRVFHKVGLYLLLLIASHQLRTVTIQGAPQPVLAWLDRALLNAVVLYEAWSILENTAQALPGLGKRLRPILRRLGEAEDQLFPPKP